MQPKAPDGVRAVSPARALQKRGKVVDGADRAVPGLRRRLPDRHLFNHVPPQRPHGLIDRRDVPVLSEIANATCARSGRLLPLSCWACRPRQRSIARAVQLLWQTRTSRDLMSQLARCGAVTETSCNTFPNDDDAAGIALDDVSARLRKSRGSRDNSSSRANGRASEHGN
jgi:hypothetical protein